MKFPSKVPKIDTMHRIYTPHLREYAGRKIILVTGPRQVGKTTLAKMLSDSCTYLNYDNEEDRRILAEKSWDRSRQFVLFDELHKMPKWKQWIKGVFDTEGPKPSLVVTGSAKLDIHRKLGDSLAGRYFQYRIHPLDICELHQLAKFQKADPKKTLTQLLKCSGFPEPFLEGNEKFYNMWKKTHMDVMLKQDMLEEGMRDIRGMETLVSLLKNRVGSPLSYLSLSRDLQRNDKTVKNWLTSLENIYVVFKLTPFHKNMARANLKKPKYYFYDIARVAEASARLENLVACALLKECHFRQDCLGEEWELFYIGQKGGEEIDFLLAKDGRPKIALEVKTGQNTPSKNFHILGDAFPHIKKIQLVRNLKREKTFPDGLEVRDLSNWLKTLPLTS